MKTQKSLPILTLIIISFLLIPNVARSAKDHNEEIEELKSQLRQLQQKITNLEKSSQSYNNDINKEDKWFDDIRITTKKGTGLTFSTIDENYKLRLRLAGQFKASLLESDGGNEGLAFEIERARIQFDGNVFRKWFKYFAQLDLVDGVGDSGVTLLDLRFDFAYNEAFVPRIGQYRVPFNREELTPTFAQQLVDRSSLNAEFEYDRDIGVGVWGKLGKWFYYQGGIFQGEGEAQVDDDDFGVLWALRVQVSPFGEDQSVRVNFAKDWSLAVGFSIAGINVEDGSDSELGGARFDAFGDGVDSGQVVSLTSDISLKNPRFNIEGEYNGRFTDPDGFSSIYDHGARVQAGVFLIPKILEVAGRFNFIDFDTAVGNQDATYEFTPGINYYLSKDHRWKLQFDYTYKREQFTDDENENFNLFRAQLQTYF